MTQPQTLSSDAGDTVKVSLLLSSMSVAWRSLSVYGSGYLVSGLSVYSLNY